MEINNFNLTNLFNQIYKRVFTLEQSPPGSASWDTLSGKPSTFPPSTHNHTDKVDVNDSRLSDARTPTSHTHPYEPADTNIQDAVSKRHSHSNATALNAVIGNNTGDQDLSGKADVNHSHSGIYEPVSSGKHLSTNDYTTVEQTKLSGIAAGAEVNVNPDWNSGSGDSQILNKPSTFPPNSHSHAESDITGLATDLAAKQPKGYLALANDTTALALATNFTVKLTVTANRTLTTTVPAAGVRCTVIILTNSTSTWTITFGTGFKTIGTLVTGTSSGKVFTIDFISDGTNLYENGARSTAMTA